MTHPKMTNTNIYLLGDTKVVGATNLQLFTINFISQNIDLNQYDALIFTSKNGAFGIEYSLLDWKTKPSFAIAHKTASVLKNMGANVVFSGNQKNGDGFANELVPLLQHKKALYIRGKDVVSNLVLILRQNNIDCDELIVYETICIKNQTKKELPKNSIIIFSSPSTIKCFLENYFWDDSFIAVTIGETTTKYIPPYIIPILSDDTSLEACVKKAMEII